MNVTLVEINIKPERVDEFLEVFPRQPRRALQEPGNLRFDVLQDPEVKTRFLSMKPIKMMKRCWRTKKTPALSGLRGEAGGANVAAAAKRSFIGLLPEA